MNSRAFHKVHSHLPWCTDYRDGGQAFQRGTRSVGWIDADSIPRGGRQYDSHANSRVAVLS